MIASPSSPFNRFTQLAPLAQPRFALRRPAFVPAPESFVLAAVCLLDLSSTLFWVAYRNASEGNPIMAYYLTHGGAVSFALAKMVLLFMPLVIAEWARLSRPKFVRGALRVGIAAYLGLYILGVAHINGQESTEPLEYAATFPQSAHAARFSRSAMMPFFTNSGWNPSACGDGQTQGLSSMKNEE